MENNPQASGPDSELCQLLEKTSNRFVDDIWYKNDPRYLNCWIQYLKCAGKLTKEHFTYLNNNGIGIGLAAFYEEYAEVMETMEW